jgi:hypothetical protein
LPPLLRRISMICQRGREPNTEQKLAMRRRLTLPPDEALPLLEDMRVSITDSMSKVKAACEKVFSPRAELFERTSKSFAALAEKRTWTSKKKTRHS